MTTSATSSLVKIDGYPNQLTADRKPQDVGAKSARQIQQLYGQGLLPERIDSLVTETLEEKENDKPLSIRELSTRSITSQQQFSGKVARHPKQMRTPSTAKLELIYKGLMSSGELPENCLWSDVAALLPKVCSQEKEKPLKSCLEMISKSLGITITHKNFNTIIISISDMTDQTVRNFIRSIRSEFQIEIEVTVKTFKKKLDFYKLYASSLLMDSKNLVGMDQVVAKEYIREFLSLKKLDLRNFGTITQIILNSTPKSNPILRDVSIIDSALIREISMSGMNFVHLEFRNLPALKNLRLSNCTMEEECLDSFEKQLPQLNALTTLELVNCQITDDALGILTPSILKLSNLTSIKLSGNAITYIPKAFDHSNLKNQVEASLKNSYEYPIPELPGKKTTQWHVERREIEEHPLDMVYNLAEKLKDSAYINVTFIGESARDVGGLSRSFFSKLFKVLKEKSVITSDGYPTWDRGVFVLGEENQMCETIYERMGIILAFLIGKRGIYPIGDIFSHEVFEGLRNCSEAIISKSYNDLSVEELASLCSQSFKKALRMDDLLQFFSAKTSFKAGQYIDAVQNIYIACGEELPLVYNSFHSKIKFSSSLLNTLKLKAKEALFLYCTSKIKPILEIAKGIKQIPVIWKVLPKLTAPFLEQTVQGTLAKGNILHNLKFQEGLPKKQREWLVQWIEKANNQKLANFLIYVSGAPSLAKGQHINVKVSPKEEAEGLSSHTCFHQLNIPPMMDRDKLWMLLDEKTESFNIK